MTKLHLGVVDLPYANGGKTTGEVAQILEDKYHVMELFVEEIGLTAITDALEKSAKDALADLIGGAPVSGLSLTLAAEEEIAAAFRVFLDQQELDGVVPGVPTQASLKGVNHRFKRPYVKTNPARPSFIDTGLYQASARAWSTES
jgi:hypothetical protein